jgi:hypothetical protein
MEVGISEKEKVGLSRRTNELQGSFSSSSCGEVSTLCFIFSS